MFIYKHACTCNISVAVSYGIIPVCLLCTKTELGPVCSGSEYQLPTTREAAIFQGGSGHRPTASTEMALIQDVAQFRRSL